MAETLIILCMLLATIVCFVLDANDTGE